LPKPDKIVGQIKFGLTCSLTVYEYIVLGNRGKTRDISVDLPTA